jgi:hypothetical protein
MEGAQGNRTAACVVANGGQTLDARGQTLRRERGPEARRERGPEARRERGARGSTRAGARGSTRAGAGGSTRAGPEARRERGPEARRERGPEARRERGQTLDASGGQRLDASGAQTLSSRACRGIATSLRSAAALRLRFAARTCAQGDMEGTRGNRTAARVVASRTRRSTRAGPKRCHPERVEGSPPASGPRLPFDFGSLREPALRVTWRARGAIGPLRVSSRAGPDARRERGPNAVIPSVSRDRHQPQVRGCPSTSVRCANLRSG